MKRLLLCLIILSFSKSFTQTWQLNSQLNHLDPRQSDNLGNAVGIHNDTIVAGAFSQDNGNSFIGHNDGAIYVFAKDMGGQWPQVQKIVAQDRFVLDRFGSHLDYDGNTIATSSEQNDRDASGANLMFDAGAAYIFTRNASGQFVQSQKLVASDRSLQAGFGSDIDLEGDVLAIGAFHESFDASGGNEQHFAGAVYIFERDASGLWSQTQKLVASDRDAEDGFGFSVQLDGNYLVVGAHYDEDGVSGQSEAFRGGSAYIFEKQTNGLWVEQQKITSSDRAAEDEFGFDVDIEGDVLVVSTYRQDQNSANDSYLLDAGAVYVYNKDASGLWSQTLKITASDRERFDGLGRVVVLKDGYIMASAYRENDHGSVYFFGDGSGSNWMNEEKFFPPTISDGSSFGWSISLFDDRAIIGGPGEDNNGIISVGTVFLYERDPNLGFNLPSETKSVRLYPNPSNSILSIAYLITPTDYTVFDLMGRKLMTGTYQPNGTMDIAHLADGRYFIKLSSGYVLDFIKY